MFNFDFFFPWKYFILALKPMDSHRSNIEWKSTLVSLYSHIKCLPLKSDLQLMFILNTIKIKPNCMYHVWLFKQLLDITLLCFFLPPPFFFCLFLPTKTHFQNHTVLWVHWFLVALSATSLAPVLWRLAKCHSHWLGKKLLMLWASKKIKSRIMQDNKPMTQTAETVGHYWEHWS